MLSRPMEVYEVLEAEYVATHGPIEIPPLRVIVDQLLDPAAARALLAPFIGTVGESDEQIVSAINRLVTGEIVDIRKFRGSSRLSPATRKAIADYDTFDPDARDLVHRRFVDEIFAGAIRSYVDVRLANLFREVHAKARDGNTGRSAVCLSGGGVRSTAYALGVLQGLARLGLLTKLDYLSTVSGGSLLGSWFSSWVRRHPRGVAGVEHELAAAERQDVTLDRRAAAEAVPVAQLRRWINYLRPQFSVMSADSWTAAGVYLRNVLVKLLVIVPLVAAAISFPRIVAYLLAQSRAFSDIEFTAIPFLLVAGIWIVWARPERAGGGMRQQPLTSMRPDASVVLWFLLPITLAALSLTLAWYYPGSPPYPSLLIRRCFYAALIGMSLVFVVNLIRTFVDNERWGEIRRRLWTDFVAFFVATVVSLALLRLLTLAFPAPEKIDYDAWARGTLFAGFDRYAYITLFVPLLLLTAFVHINVLTSISSAVRPEYERQWWLRTSSWLLVGASLWATVSFLVIYGPIVLVYQTIPTGSAGVIATVIATVLGVKTVSEEETGEHKAETWLTRVTQLAIRFSTPVFLLFAVAMLSFGTTKVESEMGFTSFPGQVLRGVPAKSVAVLNHLLTVANPSWRSLLLYGALAALGGMVSLLIGINNVSSAALHRNRLTRAVLAAARTRRRADRLSGFDPDDDFPLHLLRPEYVRPESFRDPDGFVDYFSFMPQSHERLPVLVSLVRPRTISLFMRPSSTPVVLEAVCADLNEFLDINFPDGWTGAAGDRLAVNRRILQDQLDKWLRPVGESAAPMLVMNAAMTYFPEDAPYSEDAATASFTMSPLHCGSLRTGYRPSRLYTNDSGGISLATAAAVSSAPAGVGQEFSSSPASFLRTLLNVLEPQRGWWLGNPGWGGTRTHPLANPRNLIAPLLRETLHDVDESSEWLPLSAGARFDAVGLYEMVLRRCHVIVVVDATRDPDYMYAALGNAILRIRADLGVPISLAKPRMGKRGRKTKSLYCAIGEIGYRVADGPNAPNGSLVYIKPGFYDDPNLPADVYSYGAMVRDFPHETIRPGAMTEHQFETYRTFGEYCVRAIGEGGLGSPSMDAFAAAAATYAQKEK